MSAAAPSPTKLWPPPSCADPMGDHGLMLVNGEFGRRIVKQAHRHNMNPTVMEWVWGEPWDLDEIAQTMDDMPVGRLGLGRSSRIQHAE